VIRNARAELLKLRTTPGPWVVLLVTLLFTALGIVIAFLVGGQNHVHWMAPHTQLRLRRLVGAGFVGGGVWMASIVGVLTVTTEYRHKVITTSLLVTPRRPLLLAAKSVAALVWGLILGVASLVLVALMGIPLLASAGGSVHDLLRQVGPVVPGLLGSFLLLALFGVGFGTLLKNQVGAVIAVLLVAFIIEPIIDGLWPSVGRWLPSAAAQAVAGGITGRNETIDLLTWWAGALILLAWGVVPVILGYFVTFRRDVT
jgi:hypothetical protein